jgi:4-hydroxybenzoate polyprenyltransferase
MVRALAGSCHPGPTVAVTLVGVLLGAGAGLGAVPLALLGAAVLSGQLSVGWSNDAVDAERDAGVGRTDKPAAAGRVGRVVLWRAAAHAAAATVVLSVALGVSAGVALLLLPVAGWAYNLGLKGTWFSGAAYAVGFAGLPAGVFLAAGPVVPVWAPVAGALLGLGAHVANVLPDLADDEATGVRGLPHRIGVRASAVLLAVSLGAASVLAALGPPGAPGVPRLVGAAVAVVTAVVLAVAVARRPDSRAAFPAVLVLAVLTVVLVVVGA